MNTTAMVLSGGSVKGAFQAGAIRAALEKGYTPKFLYGISVGSLNATFICQEAALQERPFEELDWSLISKNLVDFWETHVNKPSDLVNKHGWFRLAFNIMTGKFDGLADNLPLKKIVYSVIKPELLRKSPVHLRVGAVNIRNGAIMYADPSMDNFLDYVIASTSVPVVMPGMKIGGDKAKVFFDGGLRDVAPLRIAIENGANTIFCIACQPKVMEDLPFNYKNLPALADRMTDIMVNEIVNNDIGNAEWINGFVPAGGTPALEGPFRGKRKLNLIVIRPPQTINVDITRFTKADIDKMMESGYQVALDTLAGQTHP